MDTGRSVEAMSPLWFAPRVRLCIVTINAARSTKLLKNVSAVWPRLAVLVFCSHVLHWALLSTQPLNLQLIHWLFSSPSFINIQLFLIIASYIFSSKIIPEPCQIIPNQLHPQDFPRACELRLFEPSESNTPKAARAEPNSSTAQVRKSHKLR